MLVIQNVLYVFPRLEKRKENFQLLGAIFISEEVR